MDPKTTFSKRPSLRNNFLTEPFKPEAQKLSLKIPETTEDNEVDSLDAFMNSRPSYYPPPTPDARVATNAHWVGKKDEMRKSPDKSDLLRAPIQKNRKRIAGLCLFQPIIEEPVEKPVSNQADKMLIPGFKNEPVLKSNPQSSSLQLEDIEDSLDTLIRKSY